MSADREPTRVMRPGQHAEAAATARSRGTYPRAEDPELSRFDQWDRRPELAPPPIRNPARSAYWVRVGLLIAAAVLLCGLIGWFGVPAVPQ